MLVGIVAHQRLQQRRRNLIGERDGTYLYETQAQRFFNHRVDGWYYRLEHIIQQMSQTDHQQNREGRILSIHQRWLAETDNSNYLYRFPNKGNIYLVSLWMTVPFAW